MNDDRQAGSAKEVDHVKCGCPEYPECTHALYWYQGFKAGETWARGGAATRDRDDWCAGCGKMKCVCKPVAPPPQDGQGAELLGPPRGGSSSDLAGPSNLNVGVPPGCPKHKELMVLNFYDRPGSPPGNGWVCQSCAKERLAPSSGATGLIARWRQLQKYFWPDAEIPADEDSGNANWANVGQVYRDCADDLETLMAEKLPEAVAGNASAPVSTELRAALQKIVDHAKTKTACAEHYHCLLADLTDLLGGSNCE